MLSLGNVSRRTGMTWPRRIKCRRLHHLRLRCLLLQILTSSLQLAKDGSKPDSNTKYSSGDSKQRQRHSLNTLFTLYIILLSIVHFSSTLDDVSRCLTTLLYSRSNLDLIQAITATLAYIGHDIEPSAQQRIT